MLLYPIFFAVLVQTSSTPQAHETIKVSPPIIMPQELVKRNEIVLPPPTPVTFK